MYPYTMTQWLFLFDFYCFLGWSVESTYVSLKEKPPHWINRGFIRGPFLPLYGSGAIMMLVVSAPFQHNIWLTYVAGCLGATVLEQVLRWKCFLKCGIGIIPTSLLIFRGISASGRRWPGDF